MSTEQRTAVAFAILTLLVLAIVVIQWRLMVDRDRHDEDIQALWDRTFGEPAEETAEMVRPDLIAGKRLGKGDTQPVNLTKAEPKTKGKGRHAA